MRSLSDAELISVWERGLSQSPIQRSLSLLTVADPEIPLPELAGLSIGQRDSRLLQLREKTFGSQLVSVTDCPHCGDRLELSFNVADIQANSKVETKEVLSLKVDEWEVQFRLPNSLDLLSLSPPQLSPTPAPQAIENIGNQLLKRCLLAVSYAGKASGKPPPVQVIKRVMQQMAEADPQADIQLNLQCPACDYQWQIVFDILSFFWREIESWCYRTLREVHDLASAYGWRESDILAMSAQRRQLYLSMVNP